MSKIKVDGYFTSLESKKHILSIFVKEIKGISEFTGLYRKNSACECKANIFTLYLLDMISEQLYRYLLLKIEQQLAL